MAGTQRELHIDSAQVARKAPVLVLWIDDENLRAATERPHQKRRHEVGLARARVSEHSDIRVGVTLLIEWVDEHGGAGRTVSAHDKTARLSDLGMCPRKQCDQCTGVEDPLAPKTIGASRQRRKVPIEHAESARLQVAQDRAGGGADLLRSLFEALRCRRDQREIDRDVERLLLAGGKASLQFLG